MENSAEQVQKVSRMKVAAYQAPLQPHGSMDAVGVIRRKIDLCETEQVSFLCCPEAILGGLADYAENQAEIALCVADGSLDRALAPLTSNTVTTFVGFTERSQDGTLYNSAAVHHRGSIAGIYRKINPAVRRSVYAAGSELPVFEVDGLRFGILICYDTCFPRLATSLAARGAEMLFVLSNNALPLGRPDLVSEARAADVTNAARNDVWVVRADVAGECSGYVSSGSSCIVDPTGRVRRTAKLLSEDLLGIEISSPSRTRNNARSRALSPKA